MAVTRNEVFDSDVWIVIPGMTQPDNFDRLYLWDIETLNGFQDFLSQAIAAKQRVWRGIEIWLDDGVIPVGGLEDFLIEETERSSADNTPAKEFIVFPPTEDKLFWEPQFSPQRIDYLPF